MNTLFNKVFAGCDMDLYINNPECAKELLKQNREERGLSFKQVIIKRQKEFDEFGDKIAALPKAMRGKAEADKPGFVYQQARPYGKQYNSFLQAVTQIEAGQNTVFVGLKWMMISTDYYRELTDRTKITVHADDDIKLAKNNILAPGGTRIGCRKPQSDFMTGNYINALFGTPDERKEAREIFFNNQKKEETMKVNVEIAKICYNANKQYCSDNGIFYTNKTWDEMSDEYREGVVAGVAEVIADPKITPEEMHQNWLDFKEKDGWKRGDLINYDEKTHPNMVPFKKLDKVEQTKDRLFIATVRKEMKK